MINFLARLGDGDAAHAHLHELLARSKLPNLFDDHPPFQIDGNFRGAAGLAEMLLQGHAGAVHLSPALPSAWPRGAERGLRARGGFEVDLTWEGGALIRADVRSTRGGALNVRLGSNTLQRATEAGGAYSVALAAGTSGATELLWVEPAEVSPRGNAEARSTQADRDSERDLTRMPSLDRLRREDRRIHRPGR